MYLILRWNVKTPSEEVCMGVQVVVPKTEEWLPKCECQEAGQSGWSWQKMCLPKQSTFEALITGREGWNSSSQTPPPPQSLLWLNNHNSLLSCLRKRISEEL